jgi:hypothetical protein
MSHGLYRFTFSGANVMWERASDKHINEIALSPDFANDHALMIGAYGYKLNYGPYKSVDAGHTWVSIDSGIDLSFNGASGMTESLLFAPDYPADDFLFSEALSNYYRSRDRGQTWQRVDPLGLNPPTSTEPARWVLSPYFTSDRTAWIDYGRWITRDAGETWNRAGSARVADLVAREWCQGGKCGTLLLGRGSGPNQPAAVRKSFDLGRTWQCPNQPTPAWWPDVPPLAPTWLPVLFR